MLALQLDVFLWGIKSYPISACFWWRFFSTDVLTVSPFTWIINRHSTTSFRDWVKCLSKHFLCWKGFFHIILGQNKLLSLVVHTPGVSRNIPCCVNVYFFYTGNHFLFSFLYLSLHLSLWKGCVLRVEVQPSPLTAACISYVSCCRSWFSFPFIWQFGDRGYAGLCVVVILSQSLIFLLQTGVSPSSTWGAKMPL